MKKIISIICITLLLFIFTNSVSLALPTPKEIKNFAIYENELNKTTE
ncbi:MAG: hypothetical protein LBD88_02805 [Candidatus Peribacteria bacterium]|jgi:hypothetical protein|nr:hypothetical protein [Candidatus Peribacteria bacterium]